MDNNTIDKKETTGKFCLWNYDPQRKVDDTACGKWLKSIDAETTMKYCPFCGGLIIAM